MLLTEIKEKVLDGSLELKMIDFGIRSKRIWQKDIEKYKRIEFHSYIYMANIRNGEGGYRISKKVYQELRKLQSNKNI